MRIATSLARRREGSAYRRWMVFAVVLIAGMLTVPIALATHLFSDVPDSSPHHDDVARIAGAGVTAGCTPTLFCPSDPVRRDQMASFLGRGSDGRRQHPRAASRR